MNQYRRGANLERKLVNEYADKKNTVLVGRFASSKCKGKIKVDVVVLSMEQDGSGSLKLIQAKKGKQNCKKERDKFHGTKLPTLATVTREFIEVK